MRARVMKWSVLTASLVVLGLATTSAATAGVSKYGGRASVTASPGGLNFGSVAVGDSSLKLIYVTNAGKLPEVLADWGIDYPFSDDFYDASDLCFSHNLYSVEYEGALPLMPGETCVFGIYFGPGDTGTYTDTFFSGWQSDASHVTYLTTKLRGTGY